MKNGWNPIKQGRKSAVREWGKYLLWYTLLFIIVSAGVFCWFIIEQKSFCWTADTSSQYVPKAYYFIQEGKEFLRHLLEGEWQYKMFDFQIGLGEAVPTHMEPVYWLYLLFGADRIELAYGALILLRYYLAGISFSVFMKYFHYDRWNCLIGSMVYIFSGYGLFAGMQHSHFIIPMITLPLLLLAMEEIYHQKKWYLCTIFVALSFWCGYYFTYMNTILMGCYFLIRFFGGEEKKTVRIFFGKAGTIIGSYLLGIGIANITFLTTFSGYLTSSRVGATTNQKVALWDYGSKWFENVYQSFLSTAYGPGCWLRMGFIAISYLCIVLLFLRRKNWQLKSAFLLGTLFCMVPVFGYVFSGFGTITNRWCYGYAFVVALITAKMAGELRRVTGKELLFLGVSVLPYVYYGIGKRILGMSYRKTVFAAGILLVLTYTVIVILFAWKKLPDKIKTGILTCNVTVLVWASGIIFFSPNYGNMIEEFTKSGKVIEKATDTPLQVIDEVDDDSFYRCTARQNDSAQGASMMLGYNGTEFFNSTLSSPIVDYYRGMGLTTWTLTKLKGMDERGFLEAAACIKYLVMKEGKEFSLPYGYEKVKEVQREGEAYTIYENQNALPLGYCYDQVLSFEELEKIKVPMRQEVMLQAAVVEDTEQVPGCSVTDSDTIKDEQDLEITGKELSITEISCDENVEFDGETIKVKKADAVMTLRFEGLPESECYLYIRGLRMNGSSKAWIHLGTDDADKAVSYAVRGDAQPYNTSQEDFLINLGYSENGITYCTIRFAKKCKIKLEEMGIYCQPMEKLGTYVADRKADMLQKTVVSNNRVTGTVNASKEEFMVFSIPYQRGWSAYVDGVKTKIQKANLMYMGIPICQGEHEIELVYEMPGIRISLIVSAVSLMILAVALILRKKRNKGMPVS